MQRDKPLQLIVPKPWRGRARLSWSQVPPTARLVFPGCTASTPGETWLAFAGGYYVKSPACVPVIVRAGTKERRVKIGVGAPCPRQTAPVPDPAP